MRIRTVKPEFWESESVGRLSREARLLFIALFNFADDAGIFRATPRLIAGRLFPYDHDALSLVESWLGELTHEQNDMVHLYEVEGSRYGVIVNFHLHQKIDHPTRSRLPLKADSLRIREDSRVTPIGSGIKGSGIRDQGIKGSRDQGGEREGGSPPPLPPAHSPPPPALLDPGLAPNAVHEPKTPPNRRKRAEQALHDKPGSMRGGPPDLPAVIEWAEAQVPPIPHQMAGSFYDHFESNGWKVGGRTPMKNWQAGLRQWRAREDQFSAERAQAAAAAAARGQGGRR